MRSMTAPFGVALLATAALSLGTAQAQGVNDANAVNAAPNPYQTIDNWAQLPPGRVWGMAIGLDIDRDGRSVWVFDRCGAKTCTGSQVAPIQKFDASGKLLASFGAGMFNFPHGLFVDRDNNIWVSDGKGEGGKGHTVIKFSPTGQVLMTIGTPGVAGTDESHFNAPSDVLVAPNGDIFVADGHGGDTNARVVKFSKDGKFITEWKQFGRPSGVFIDRNDMIYVADSQSGEKYNKGFRQGIRIGSVKDGKVIAFIDNAGTTEMPEGVAADAEGNVFGGFTANQTVKKFVKTDRRAEK